MELINNIKNLDDYTAATQNYYRMRFMKIHVNIATVLALKKIRSLEIEYFNKCDENGVACLLFQGLLALPPSKAWNILAEELIYLLQYWLEAIRKHLVKHSTRWWLFLKLILRFIKEIRHKASIIPNMLVELTSECLFDLATSPGPDVYQRHEILYCSNVVSEQSGREIRFAMRTKFGEYFVKIASHLAASGYLPGQFSSLECLIRWLVPRNDKSLRVAAAEKWLPPDLCPLAARNIFLSCSWMNFFQDARDFLNIINKANGLVTSVICRQLSIGEMVVINGTERNQSWLDFNTSGKSITVLLEPQALKAFGVSQHRACETLLIDNEITETAFLRRDSLGLTIYLRTLRAPYIRPTEMNTGNARLVSIVVSSNADLRTLDGAMRNTFGDKYQLMLDLDTDVTQSPQRSHKNKEISSGDDTRFSHPVETKKRKHSGYIVKPKNAGMLKSPSSVSTSSLVLLRDRLTELPRFQFDKVGVSVCAQPALSNVSEGEELIDQDWQSITSTKLQPYGVCQRSFKPRINPKTTQGGSKSEGETAKPKSRGGRRTLSPVASDDNGPSLLLVATINSANDTVINETIERLSKSKDFQEDDIVNLLIQEAFEANSKSRDVSDSGINTDDKKSQDSEAINDTPNEKKGLKVPLKKNCTVISKSTDDESNTEAINDTPSYVSTRNTRNYKTKLTGDALKIPFSVDTIEEFFSQHIAENQNREVIISPALAKKINKTSSDTSDNFDDNILLMNEEVHTDIEENIFNEIAVNDCLNDMVEKVCNEIDKVTKCISEDSDNDEANDCFKQKRSQTSKPQKQTAKKTVKPRKQIKKAKPRLTKKAKLEQENIKKMSTIIEQKEEENPESETENVDVIKVLSPDKKLETCVDTETPIVRRKRKLYSPKDIDDEIQEFTQAQKSDDIPLSKIKTRNSIETTATCYKELEQERKKYNIRLPRSRRSKTRFVEMPSPRTIKMDAMFENVKQIVGGNEEITLVDKSMDAYNFSSDSDDDFRKKREIKKAVSTTTVGSSSTAKKGRKPRRAKESQNSSDTYETYTNKTQRKNVKKRTNKNTSGVNISVDIVGEKIDLIDERMREAVKEQLNTSIVIEDSSNLEPMEIDPAIKVVAQMEEMYKSVPNTSKKNPKETQIESLHCSTSNDTVISKNRVHNRKKKIEAEQTSNNEPNETVKSKKKVTKRMNKNTELLKIKKEKELRKETTISDKDDEGTISPLPGLVVESMPKHKEDINDSLTTNMLQKFKKLYRDGRDVINDSITTQNMLSDVDKINYSAQCFEDDIHYVDDKENIPSDNKSHKRSIIKNTKKALNDDAIEIIHIENCNGSEVSIATDGITAHGDLDEAPPGPENIAEKFEHREIQDMDQSIRDYFNKLTRELRNSTSKDRESSKSVEGEEVSTILRNEIEKTRAIISPVISLKRLSPDDYRKWMPSRRTSDTDTIESTSGIRSRDEKAQSNNNSAKTSQKPVLNNKPTENSTPESIKLKSPIALITRIPSAEIEKWLPMPKKFEMNNASIKDIDKSSGDLKLVYLTKSKAKTAEVEGTILKEKIKCVNNKPTTERTEPVDVETDSDCYIDLKDTNTRILRKRSKFHKTKIQYADDSDTDETEKPSESTKNTKTTRNSIKKRETKELNTDIDEHGTPRETSNRKTEKTKSVQTIISDSESPKRKNKDQSTISPINFTSQFVSQIETKSSDDEYLKTIRNRFIKTKTLTSKRIESIESSPIKRKSNSPVLERKKAKMTEIHKEPERIYEQENSSQIKKKVEILKDVVFTPSESSVNDWFRKMVQSDHNTSLKDIIDNVMERLDTTIVETNQNTSKKFVKLFVDLETNLSGLREELRTMYKEEAKEQFKKFCEAVDKKYIELDKKSQEMYNILIVKFKKQTFDLIRDECHQRRAMVLMLKEDVQAVKDHIANIERTSSP